MPLHPGHVVAVSAFLALMAALLAVVEIESEGRYGWAEKLPTWYRINGPVSKRFYRLMNRPMTGYHTVLFCFVVTIFVWPDVASGHLTWASLASAAAQFFAWSVLWDFGWFCLNPYYGVRGFRRQNIWWFAREPWFGPVPATYVISLILSLDLAAISGVLHGGVFDRLQAQLLQWGCYTGAALVLTAIAPLFRWYHIEMHAYDDRPQVGIFH